MNSRDPLQCTYADASRATLLRGIALDTRAKVAFFEEMVSFAVAFGARDRLADRQVAEARASKTRGKSETG
jgi:hypothetical protein